MLWGRGDLASMRGVLLRKSYGGPSVGQEIPPAVVMEPKIHFPADTSSALDPVLSQFTPLPPLSHHFFNTLYGIGSVYLHLLSNISSTFLTCLSACCMYRLSLVRFDHPITGS